MKSSSVQLSLFPCHGTGVKDNQNGSSKPAQSMNLRAYVHTKDFLWRLLACFPGDMPLVEALRQAPQVIFASAPASLACHQRDARKEVAL